MAARHTIKRMARERMSLEAPSDDYIVVIDDNDLLEFEAYVIGPSNTLYSNKFVKIRFKIPNNYPLEPPICKFIQHVGGRIHPNLYTDGKVCLSILGTWAGEKWAMAMTCETVLITIRSLLDNKPYTHEPMQNDNPAYNDFVQYGTWRWLLLDYLRCEQNPTFKSFLQTYVAKHGDEMVAELRRQADEHANVKQFVSPYGGRDSQIIPDYTLLIQDVERCVGECKDEVAAAAAAAAAAAVTAPAAVAAVKDSEGVDLMTSCSRSPKARADS